jgi:heptosyltransferase-2
MKKYYRQRLGLILFKIKRDIPTVSARYSELGEALGFPALEQPAGGIDVPAAVRDRIRTRLAGLEGGTVSVAPGSRWPMKRWGMEKYLALTRLIVERMGLNVVLLGDRTDIETTAPISNAFGRNVINLAGQTSILEAAAVMEHTVAFVGNDSGLMHLSEAVGVPIVALFGPTVENFGYFPSNPRSRVIERGLGCRPCSRNGSRHCPKGTQECLTQIPVESVERALTDLIDNRGPNRYIIP